ncbi:PH domain-containing protein [Cellulomonas endometrii]|uniref:PH domain-containing protein n=1 Tax=Cellulomonas endometrii TaxID=3036301 RepID=UPI0024AD864A|nr:PH domain-containing protein [Cellulomonas endometrii]
MGPTHVFCSTYGRVLTGASAVVAVIVLVSMVVSDGVRYALAHGAWALLGVVLVAALFWLPRVVVSDGGVEVRNVWRTVQVPWPAFRGVEAGYSLEVRTTEGRVSAWAAPRASGTVARLRRGSEAEGPRSAPADAVLRHPGTADGAARAVADRYQRLQAAGHLSDAERAVEAGVTPRSTWHGRTIAVVAVLLVAGVLGSLVG